MRSGHDPVLGHSKLTRKAPINMHNHENYVDLSHQKHAHCRKTIDQGFKALFKNTAATNVAF